MTPDPTFDKFLIAHPEQTAAKQPTVNKYGARLNPSGMYAYWAWQGKTKVIDRVTVKALCGLLAALYGEGVKDGKVTSWDKP